MNIELVKIEIDDVEDDSNWGPSGEVYLKVNGKGCSIIVHGCGELDFEGDDLTDEEADAALDFFNASEAVNKCFPANQYE